MQVEKHKNLSDYNTFHIEAIAENFCSIENKNELLEVLSNKPSPIKFLGGGSNVLITQNVGGLIIQNKIKGITIIEENKDFVHVCFGSGEIWHECVEWAVNHGYGGIENLSLIPGTIGAAPMQNIGAYGVELKDVFVSLQAIHLHTLEENTFSNEACEFGYRESVFKHELKDQYFILSVTLALRKSPLIQIDYGSIRDELLKAECNDPTIKDVSKAVIRIRQSKLPDPHEIGNAGSFFKNPVVSISHWKKLLESNPNIPFYEVAEGYKIPAAWLIEHCGPDEVRSWKGYRIQDYGVHQKQALVLVNYNKANGQDILALSEQIIQSVEHKFGIRLHREVNIW